MHICYMCDFVTGWHTTWRVHTPARGLRMLGHTTEAINFGELPEQEPDLVVLHRPNRMACLNVLELCHENEIPVIVEVDDLFAHGVVPPEHPCYQMFEEGGWPEALEACCRAAEAVTVTTTSLAQECASWNRHVYILENCWDDTIALWQRPPEPEAHDGVWFGFAGSDTHSQDFRPLVDELTEFFLAHPEARLVIGAATRILPLFTRLPEEQKIFLPPVPQPEYARMVAQFDVVLAPLLPGRFNNAKSAIRLMEAGLCRKPVVASPTASYVQYAGDGQEIILAGPGEWRPALERLLGSPELRRQMGEAGRAKAERYAISRRAHLWEQVYTEVVSRFRSMQPVAAAGRWSV